MTSTVIEPPATRSSRSTAYPTLDAGHCSWSSHCSSSS